jgi:hypothetical protein
MRASAKRESRPPPVCAAIGAITVSKIGHAVRRAIGNSNSLAPGDPSADQGSWGAAGSGHQLEFSPSPSDTPDRWLHARGLRSTRKGDKNFWCRGGSCLTRFLGFAGRRSGGALSPFGSRNPGPPLPVRKTDLRVARLRVTTAQIAPSRFMLSRLAFELPGRDEIHEDADQGNNQDHRSLRLGWRHQAADALVDDQSNAGDLLLPGLCRPGVWAAPRLACGCQHVSASVQLDAHAADLVRAKARLHRGQNP